MANAGPAGAPGSAGAPSGGQNTFGQDISQAGGSIVPTNAGTPSTTTGSPNPQTANGGATPAISVSDLSTSQTPINPPQQPSVNTGSVANSSIPTTAEATQPESAAGATPSEQAGTGILASIANIMKGNTSLATLQTTSEANAGIPQQEQNVTNLTAQQTALQNQLTQLQNEAAPGGALESAEQQQAEGRGITTAGLAPMSAADQRSNEIQQSNIVGQNLALGSTIASAQGNLTLAKTLADKAAQVQYDSTQQELGYENSLLASIQPYITADQKAQADEVTANLADRTNQVNAAISNRSGAISEVGKFAQIASPAVLQQMQNAPDAATVDQIAAANGLVVPVSGRYSSVQTTTGYGVLDSTTGQMVTGTSYPSAAAATQAANSLNGGGSNTTSTGVANVVSAAGGSYDLSTYATAPGYTAAIQQIVNTMPQINNAQTAQSYITANFPNSPITGAMVMSAANSSGVDPTVMMAIMQKETQMGTDGSAGAEGDNYGNVGNTDSAMAPGGSGAITMNSPQAGVQAVAGWLANHQQQYNASSGGGNITTQAPGSTGTGTAQLPIAQYGLLANTDFNPNSTADVPGNPGTQQGVIDNEALQYINSYLQNGSVPSSSSLGRNVKPGLFSLVQSRANDIYFQATGTSLQGQNPSVLAAQQKLLATNLGLQNTLDNQVGTISKNFGLNLANMTANNVNQAAPIINGIADSLAQALGYTSTAQYLAQNETIQNELGTLLAVKNAGGTTVADKISAGDLLPSDLSVAQQKQILTTLMQEAQNQSQSIQQTNAGIYKQIDPLNMNPNNPAQAAMRVESSLDAQGIDYQTIVSNTPNGQIPVMDNASGRVGYIDPTAFDASIFTKL